jgi:hypothetical protein
MAGVCAFPMRLRADRIGALNVFQATPGALDEAAALAGQALADVATIAILQARAVEDAARLAGQVVEGSFTLDAETGRPPRLAP